MTHFWHTLTHIIYIRGREFPPSSPAAPLPLPPSEGGRYRWGVPCQAAPKGSGPIPSDAHREETLPQQRGTRCRPKQPPPATKCPILTHIHIYIRGRGSPSSPRLRGGKIQMGGPLPGCAKGMGGLSLRRRGSPLLLDAQKKAPSYIIGTARPWTAPSNHERSFIRLGSPGPEEKPGPNGHADSAGKPSTKNTWPIDTSFPQC